MVFLALTEVMRTGEPSLTVTLARSWLRADSHSSARAWSSLVSRNRPPSGTVREGQVRISSLST